jgi:predicted dehydrogenase
MVRSAIDRGLHVFCEKPLTLSSEESIALCALARERGCVVQVGYHNRFVATFAEVKRIIASGSLGKISHALAESYGPVVLKPAKRTWRSKAEQGGGCLYDYAAHPINLLNWFFGDAEVCTGAIMKSGFSAEVDDEVYATLSFEGGVTAQLSVNWSDPSVRKMMTRVTIWGSKGRVSVDRQEVQLFLAEADPAHPQYAEGWNVRYITELTPPVSFYLRGEEYTAQLESFGNATRTDVRGPVPVLNDISSAAETDATIELIREAANSFSTESARPKGTVRHSGKGLSRLVFGRRV